MLPQIKNQPLYIQYLFFKFFLEKFLMKAGYFIAKIRLCHIGSSENYIFNIFDFSTAIQAAYGC